MAIASGSFQPAIQVSAFDTAVSGAQANLAFCAFDANVSVARVNVHIAVDGLGFDRTVAGIHIQIRRSRHVNFDPQGAVASPTPSNPIPYARADLNLVAILP